MFECNNMFMLWFKLDKKKIFDFFWAKKFFQSEMRLEFEGACVFELSYVLFVVSLPKICRFTFEAKWGKLSNESRRVSWLPAKFYSAPLWNCIGFIFRA